MPVKSPLGDAIKARRVALGWTQEELAARVSVDGEYLRQSEISRIENGRIALPRRERLERIANVLGLSLGELLSLSGWAGADQHFPVPATAIVTDSVVERDERDVHVAPTIDVDADRLLINHRGWPDPRAHNRSAMAAFRQAMATMRSESDRLKRNRQAVLETERSFRQLPSQSNELTG